MVTDIATAMALLKASPATHNSSPYVPLRLRSHPTNALGEELADRMQCVDVLPAGPTPTSAEAEEGPWMPHVMVRAVKDSIGVIRDEC
jgi:hypothetical protein